MSLQARGRNTDAEVVRTAELGPLIQEWIDNWYRERPAFLRSSEAKISDSRTGYWAGIQPPEFESPWDVLERETGKAARQIRAIIRQEYEYTAGRIADAILVAMGNPHWYGTRVTVIPNPKWSQERWNEYMAERGCIEDISC